MSLDYPDSMEHVERTPVQRLLYQIYGIKSFENQTAEAESYANQTWDLSDDGYMYLIDTIFCIVDHLQPFDFILNLCNDTGTPVYYTLAEKRGNGDIELVASRMGAFAISYPKGLQFMLYNYRASSVQYSIFCNYFKYPIED